MPIYKYDGRQSSLGAFFFIFCHFRLGNMNEWGIFFLGIGDFIYNSKSAVYYSIGEFCIHNIFVISLLGSNYIIILK